MGSFHSESVDTLMSQPDSQYQPPSLPFSEAEFKQNQPVAISCDHESTNDFLLDRDRWTFLNHGAFGAALRQGYERAEAWRWHLERQPLRYHDRELLPHLVFSARRLARFCHAPRDSFTLIPNVTYGLNTILKGYAHEYKEDAHIILWDTSYGSLKKMAHEYCPQKVTEIPVSEYFDRWKTEEFRNNPLDVFACALMEALQALDNDGRSSKNALLILDHTTSNTALNMPLKSLSKIAKDRGMLVMVDGAHGILAQELVLNETSLPCVDFYLGNGHKWLSCPRGIGFLYCPDPKLRDTILRLPAVISHGVGQGFQSRFLWDGCRDYAAALAVPAVLDFWEQEYDPARVRLEIQDKLSEAVALLKEQWHGATTEEDLGDCLLAPQNVHAPMMTLVKLPNSVQSFSSNSEDAKAVQDFLYDNFVEVPIKCVQGTLYVRLSCHVYNELHEYQRLADTMLRFPEKGKRF